MHKYTHKDKKNGTTVYGSTHKPTQKKECKYYSYSYSSSSSSSEEEYSCDNGDKLSFEVFLSYAQEVLEVPGSNPVCYLPAPSTAPGANTVTGRFEITFKKDFSSAQWKLYVFGATNPSNRITSAHLHTGFAGENGAVIVTLFPLPGQNSPVNVNGLLSKGVLTNAGITSIPGYSNVASLYAGILRGNVYVNVHSELLLPPTGAARGQIFASCA